MDPNTQPDYIALGMVIVLLVIVAVLFVRKWLSNRAAAKAEPQATVSGAAPAPAPGTGGKLRLNSVDPKTAAMLMAIVADQTGKPLNELRFISIEEVDE